MIARLLEIEVCGFRCFANEITVPLDADVVLIQGPNGSGKTCLVSALEFALTGRVQELSKFELDYPRCLKHLSSNEPTRAAVRFRTSDNVERTSIHESDSASEDSAFSAMSRDDLKFFRDRCYLSQSSLGRLLENYQAYTKENPEQPLVRFVRELLGLDLLENLTAGLHDAGNVLRIEKSVPALAQARSDEVASARKLQELAPDLALRRTEWEQALTALQAAVAELGDPIPGEPWSPEGVAKRTEVHMRASKSRSLATSMQELRHA
jgi:DNA repair protein SbcC/Rad50